MSEILSTISNFLSASWRAGAALFVLGASVYLSKLYGVPPLSELGSEWYQGAVLAGVLGFGFLVVHGLVLLAQGIRYIVPRLSRLIMAPAVEKRKQELSLKNWDAISEDELICLLWIRNRSQQRFKASRANRILYNLYTAHLLEQDISEREEYASDIHWIVPDVIWDKLQKLDVKKLRINLPRHPPWEGWKG